MHKQFAGKFMCLVVSRRYIKVTYALSPTLTPLPPSLSPLLPHPTAITPLHCRHPFALSDLIFHPSPRLNLLLLPLLPTYFCIYPHFLHFRACSFKSYCFLYIDYTWSWDTGMEFRETRRVSRYLSLYVLETWWVDWCSYWWPAANSQW